VCREALEYRFATICVNPTWIALAASIAARPRRRHLRRRRVPAGGDDPRREAHETRRAIFDGATEVDMVINVGALKSGDLRLVERDIEAVTIPCRDSNVTSKVIIEAALLTDDEKVAACTLAKAAGADFVKTSTGFAKGAPRLATSP